MSSTSESGGGSAGPSAYHVMERDLKPWDLYSLDGAENPDRLDMMKEYFTRYRQLQGKKTNNAYTHDALQRSCASGVFATCTWSKVAPGAKIVRDRRAKSGSVK
ncbi:hypothetical protein PR003_g32335 [Phytophthora rubi]|uniref:Uncharacterized protein n=1 Tax=Phytophthora rubi TaxID=129364 RepID=A0A6A4B3J5_9STRA|nr:hypothetical protein PR003_g32335 [Phytophthora rubi]